MRRGSINSLMFGGRVHQRVSTAFAVAEKGSYAHPYPDGIIGIRLLHDYKVVFDLASKRVAFVSQEGTDD